MFTQVRILISVFTFNLLLPQFFICIFLNPIFFRLCPRFFSRSETVQILFVEVGCSYFICDLYSCVCTSVQRPTSITGQNNNFQLKAVVRSAHGCLCSSNPLKCATLCRRIMVVMVFQLLVRLFLERQRAQVGNQLKSVIYRENCFTPHCTLTFLWASSKRCVSLSVVTLHL